MYKTHLLLALGLPLSSAAETVLGVYLFSRHGDRSAKALGNTKLTELGYDEVFTTGDYYRSRYIANGAPSQIARISADMVQNNQLAVSSPYDNVLMPSAQGFLQGLYPPLGTNTSTTTLRNGSAVSLPLNGFQLIPVQTIATGGSSENSAWLQGQSSCANAIASSNQYFSSNEYMSLLNSTRSFYQNFTNLTNGTYDQSQMSFTNAYTIFDLFNVAEIHNRTFDPQGVLNSSDNFFQIRTLADTHEWGLAYNASSTIRAIAGKTLAYQVVHALNSTITGAAGSKPLNIQFGPYGTFSSYFGLANLTAANPDFYGVCDYASTMVWELVTNSTDSRPNPEDIGVRFYFKNGTASSENAPTAYPLFGHSSTLLKWDDFVTGMNKFAVGGQDDWCQACGNSTGVCASTASASANGNSNGNQSSDGNHLSNAVAGVIGAMVTLAVILGLEILAILIGGLRVVSKKRLNAAAAPTNGISQKA